MRSESAQSIGLLEGASYREAVIKELLLLILGRVCSWCSTLNRLRKNSVFALYDTLDHLYTGKSGGTVMMHERGTNQGIPELFKDSSGQKGATATGPARFHQGGKPNNMALPRCGCV